MERSNRGQPTGSIYLRAHNEPWESSHLRLRYTVNKEQQDNYRVQLEQQPSNLPGAVGGHRWHLVCLTTGRWASVLYPRNGTGVFAHRLAFP